MEYLGNALVAMAIIVTSAVAIVWITKTIYAFIAKSRKEALKQFEEPLKELLNTCVKASGVLFKVSTKELEKMNSDDDVD